MSRVETGIVMFKYKDEEIDWPGVYIRGDDCFMFLQAMKTILNTINDHELAGTLKYYQDTYQNLVHLLESSNIQSSEHKKDKIQFVETKNV